MHLLDKKNIKFPVAQKAPTILTKHGDARIDNYYWMKLTDEQKNAEDPDEQTQKVVHYLNAENDYRENMMSHLKGIPGKTIPGDKRSN